MQTKWVKKLTLPVLAMLFIYYATRTEDPATRNLVDTMSEQPSQEQSVYSAEESYTIYAWHESDNLVKTFVPKGEEKDPIQAIFDIFTTKANQLPVGTTSLISPMTTLNDYHLEDGVLTLNVSPEFLDYTTNEEQDVLSSLVWTYTELVDVDKVKFEIDGEVDFRNVSFVYPDTGIAALKNFNLKINKGDKVAITGKTGSGKTTIAQLMLRMYDANSGTISYDGNDIRSFEISSLRKQISYVPQDVFLFSDTVENNIRFAISNAKREDVIDAAEAAGVAKEIEGFSDGYDTVIGERGVTLSGGQKQRISIARALLKKPSLVIFDDCLSAVDAKTEQEIMGKLQQYLKNKTAVIITHRVFSLLSFDKIIVLDDGEIVEQGTHDELMKIPNGFYAKLYTKQQQGRYDDDDD